MNYLVAKMDRETTPNLICSQHPGGFTGEAHSATISHHGNWIGKSAISKGRLVAPLVRRWHVPETVDQTTGKLTFGKGALSYANSFSDGWMNGASLRVYRMIDGELVEMGETEITETSVKIFAARHVPGQMVAPGEKSFVWSMPAVSKAGMVIHFAVAAVNAAGERGPWTAPVAFTFGAGPVSSDAAQNLVAAPKSFDNQPLSRAVPVPGRLTATGMNGGMTVRLDWSPVAGMGHVIAFSYHPDMTEDQHVIVKDASFIQPGDFLVWSKRFGHDTTRAGTLSPRVWNDGTSHSFFGIGGVGAYNETMPAGVSFAYMNEDGRDFLRLTVAEGRTYKFETYSHSGTGQGFYDVLDPAKTYRMMLKARADVPVNAAFLMNGIGQPAVTRHITTDWAEITADFSPAMLLTDRAARSSQVQVTGPVTLDVEMFHIGEAGTEPLMATPDLQKLLIESGISFVRNHATCKTHPKTYSMWDVLQEYGPPTLAGNSLCQFFRILDQARAANGGHGLNPWIQIEGHMSDAENRLLGGWLCSPHDPDAPDSPEQQGAALRAAQGQATPWQQVFDQIIVECGNENWQSGAIPEFYNLPTNVSGASAATLNGKLLDRLAGAIIRAPGHDPARFRFYLGGRTAAFGWNADSIAASAHADLIGYADYNGGWDSGLTSALQAGDPGAVFKTLANTSLNILGGTRAVRMAELAALCDTASAGRAKPIRPMNYEAGPGYALPGNVTEDEKLGQERLMKSVAAGTATLDAFLMCTVSGILSSNFFTLGGGTHWKSGSKWFQGGADNPPFQWFCFINRHLIGQTRLLDPLTSEPLTDLSGVAQGSAVRVYQVTRPDGRQAFAILNLDPSETRRVKLRVRSGHGWTRHWMTGELDTFNFTAETANEVTIMAAPMPDDWGSHEITATIPPGKAEIYIENQAA